MGDDQQISDEQIVAAIRRRLLDEVSQRSGGQSITNNVYGGSVGGQPSSGQGGGILDRFGGGQGGSGVSGPEDKDYFVDILREELQPGDVVDGQEIKRPGWRKKVHRFATAKSPDDPGKKKVTEG